MTQKNGLEGIPLDRMIRKTYKSPHGKGIVKLKLDYHDERRKSSGETVTRQLSIVDGYL